MPVAISRTTLWKEALGSRRLVDRWYFLTSRRAPVPGFSLLFTLSLTPPEAGADFLMVLPFAALLGIFLDADLAAILDFGIVCSYVKVFKMNY